MLETDPTSPCPPHLRLCSCVSADEYVVFFDRLVLVRKCEQVAGSELTSRTNVLLVRQNLLAPGDGVVFTYSSQKNPKMSHRRGNWIPTHTAFPAVTDAPPPRTSTSDSILRPSQFHANTDLDAASPPQIVTSSCSPPAVSSRTRPPPAQITPAGFSSTPRPL